MQELPAPSALFRDMLPRLKYIRGRQQEHVVCLSLDASYHVIHRHTVFIGTVSQAFSDPREIYARALKCFASSIVIAHNHPSGVAEPSDGDIEATQNLLIAGEILGVHLQDHIIVARHEEYSFAASGLLLPVPLLMAQSSVEDDDDV